MNNLYRFLADVDEMSGVLASASDDEIKRSIKLAEQVFLLLGNREMYRASQQAKDSFWSNQYRALGEEWYDAANTCQNAMLMIEDSADEEA